MATFITGSQVYGRDFPPSQYDQDWTVIANVTTTSFVAGTPVVAVAYTAPTSGKAFVSIGCGIRNNAATNERAEVSYRVYEDSDQGLLFQDTGADVGVKSCGIAQSQEFRYVGHQSLVTDLTPGRQYYFQVVHRSLNGAGTADIASRSIMVIPVP